jgi:membrane protein DedA with SNARE-associated domain
MIDLLHGYSAHLIYVLLFFLLFLCGLGFPMAEELVLLAGGVLVAAGMLNPVVMFLAVFLGVIIGDMMLFWVGRGLATRLGTSTYFTRWFAPGRLTRGAVFFARYGNATVFLARFIPGLRAPTFLLAGTLHMGLWRFVVIDMLAALIFVPMLCWMGFFFADRVDAIASWFQNAERVVFTLLALTTLSWLLWHYRGKRNEPVPTSHTSPLDRP